MSQTDDKITFYLDYLDKEMTIVGVLSTFCVAGPWLVLERVASAEKGFLAELWQSGHSYFWFASVLMFIAGGLYYKQRSVLAWYYGQISLKTALPEHNTKEIGDWLKDVDSWCSWIYYNAAFYAMVTAICEYAFARFSINFSILRGHAVLAGVIPVVSLVVFGTPNLLMMAKYPYEDNPRLTCFKRLFRSRSK